MNTNVGLGGYNQYALYGTLADGTALNGKTLYVDYKHGAKFTLNAVPEPGSVALLVGMMTVGAGVLRKRRK